jgi:hypothetical protein
MVERWAICYNNICDNICMWDGVSWSPENPTAWQPPAGAMMINVQNMWCDIGAIWDGTQFNPAPVVETPEEPNP